MTKNELAKLLEEAAKNGNLLTDKHNPEKLSDTRSKPRTVIAAELVPKLPEFFASRDFKITQYENTEFSKTPAYWEITPTKDTYNIPASGVPAYASTPTSQCNRLIVVSGENQGLHIFGESSDVIEKKFREGKLKNRQDL